MIQRSISSTSFLLVALLSLATSIPLEAVAQSPSSLALPVPFSNQEHGGVAAVQNGNSNADRTVSTIQSSVTASGRFQGSMPDPSDSGAPVTLSLQDAVRRGLQFNLGAASEASDSTRIRGERLEALSHLLPNVTGNISENVTQLYLPAEGLSASLFGASSSLHIPLVTGQYHYYSLSGHATENVLDLTALHNLKAASASVSAADLNVRDAHEIVVLTVGGTYLQVLADAAVVEAQKREIEFANVTYQRASELHASGVRPRIDVDRSLVELRTEQQRLESYEAELSKEKIRLARLIGLHTGTRISLSDSLADKLSDMKALDDYIQHSLTQRNDLQAAREHLQAAEQAQKAARSESLPTLSIGGHYGLQGTTMDTGRIEYNGVVSVNVPIWQGGRAKADTQQANAVVAEQRMEYQDLGERVEADVRVAYIDATVAARQVAVARENQSLARETVLDAQDRFQAGVTDSVELVQAHQIMASADRDYIASLFSQSLARLRLAQAEGTAEQDFELLVHQQ